MATYRKSTLAAEAPGVTETITRWSGEQMGGRVPAFVGLAQRTGGLYLEAQEDKPLLATEALRSTDLDFEVRLERTYAHVNQEGVNEGGEPVTITTPIEVPDYRTTVMHYNDGRQPVPITPWVSPNYQTVQNGEALAVGDAMTKMGGGYLAALGAWGRPLGAKVYAAYALTGINVGGGDPYGLFLTITTAHDGMGGLSFRLAPVRFECTNESPLYFGRGAAKVGPVFTRRHTKNVLREAELYATQALGLAERYREIFAAEAERALKVKVTENQAITYWRQVFGVKDGETPKPAQQDREDTLTAILNGPTCQFGRGTAYAAFQAVTEYMDWMSPVRGGDDAATATRQRRIVEGMTDEPKQRAWTMALAI
jgi:hypothetical protein